MTDQKKFELKRKVSLVIDEDLNGLVGFIPKEAYSLSDLGGFDSFQTHLGLFHDVFEHDFENEVPEFTGVNSFNIGGEIAAIGHSLYYSEISDRLHDNYYGPQEISINVIIDLFERTILGGDNIYGNLLYCNVDITPLEELDSSIEYISSEIMSKVAIMSPNCYFSQSYKDSITFEKVSSLLQWGYNRAYELAPSPYGYPMSFISFNDFFKSFFDNNDLSELSNYYKNCNIEVFQGDYELKWKFTMESLNIDMEDIVFESTNENLVDESTIYVEEYFMYSEDY